MRKFILFLSALLFVGTLSAQELKVAVSEKGKCGYVDQQGNEVVKCKYTLAFPFKDGLGKVGKGDKFGFVDATGKEVLPVKYEEITPWAEGIYRLRSGDKYGLFFVKDNMVLKPQYSVIGQLNQYGKALLTAGGKNKDGRVTGTKIGLIDANGKVLVKPAYEKLYEFEGGTFLGKLSGTELKVREAQASAIAKANARNKKNGVNVTLSQPQPYGISVTDTLKTDCKYFHVQKGKKAAVMADNGSISPFFKNVVFSAPTSGMCMYYLREKKPTFGYWDFENNKDLLIAKKVDLKKEGCICAPFAGNIAPVIRLNNKNKQDPQNLTPLYFINKKGEKVSENYVAIYEQKSGYWMVYDKDGANSYTKDGVTVTELSKFNTSVALRPTDGSTSYRLVDAKYNPEAVRLLDGNGQCVFDFGKYLDIMPRQDGETFVVRNQEGLYGVVDRDGREILPFEYSQLQEYVPQLKDGNGYLWGKKNNKSGVIDPKNNIVVPFEYLAVCMDQGKNITNVWVRKDATSLWQNYDIAKQAILGPSYSLTSRYIGDYAWAVPADLKYPANVNLLAKLCVVYKANADLKMLGLGVLVDKEGKQVTSYPIPQGVFQAMADKVKENGGSLSPMQERSLLYKLIRNEFKYELQSTIPNEEWEF
ncbi:MAG: WG repeat-containing protein [Bacteroidaceae bacterium]|nr:WG repeat-containing protein [Bacteroidaceae bacterium]